MVRHMHSRYWRVVVVGVLGALALCQPVWAQLPVALTDTIQHGSGSIDLLRNISSAELRSYFRANQGLLLAVDLNEDLGGNESRDSIGVAIRQMNLVITSTAGTYTFSDFFTSTSAMITEAGTTSAQQFQTLFGRSGSSQITGRTGDAALDSYDDVVRVVNVAFEGDIVSARLDVTFLRTADTGKSTTEAFFDFSGGFEDFALIGKTQAATLEAANYGVTEAPASLAFTEDPPPSGSAPGAPAPPFIAIAIMGALFVLKYRNGST